MLPSTAISHRPFLGVRRASGYGKRCQSVYKKTGRRPGSAVLSIPAISFYLSQQDKNVVTRATSGEAPPVNAVMDAEKGAFYDCINGEDLNRAEELFKDITDKDIPMYNRIIKACLRNKESYKSWNYYNGLLSNGLEPDLITYSIMMHVCAIEKKLDSALELWAEVESKELAVDKVLYNSMIQTCMMSGAPDKGKEFLDSMLDRGIRPDVVTFNTMIGGYARVEMDPKQALEAVDVLLLKMKELGIELDGGTYMSLMRMSLTTDDPDKAIQYIDELIDCGFELSPSIYCSLIEEYTRSYKGRNSRKVLEQCWRVYLDMEDRGIQPTSNVYAALLRLFVRWGQWRHAFGLLDLMTEKNYNPSAEVYSILLEGLAYNKRIGREVIVMTKILIEELQIAKMPLPRQAYRSILNIYLDARDINSAQEHFQRMKRKFRVDTRDYDRFLNYYADIRYTTNWEVSYEAVIKVVEEMKLAALKLDLTSYATVIKICAKCQKWKKLEAFCLEMKERNLHPPISIYNVILDACVKEADADAIERAWRFFNEMKDYRLPLNVITYTTMINVCVAAEDAKAGYQLLDEMRTAGVYPNERTYSSLMHLAGEAGDLDRVYQLFGEMADSRIVRNAATYNVLISACGKAKEADKLMHAFEDMKAAGISMDLSVFCNLIRALGMCERGDLVYKVYDEFRQRQVYLSHKAFELMSTTLETLGDTEGAAAIQQLEKETKPAF